MEDQKTLGEYRETIQKIINKYFSEDKRFSVENFGKEQLWYICRLFLEKDDKKRGKIRKEIEYKLNHAKFEYERQYYEIIKNKELFDNHNNIIKDVDNLVNDIESESELDDSLDEI